LHVLDLFKEDKKSEVKPSHQKAIANAEHDEQKHDDQDDDKQNLEQQSSKNDENHNGDAQDKKSGPKLLDVFARVARLLSLIPAFVRIACTLGAQSALIAFNTL
jgi:hypothetical protein